jgi:hypothetical protein
MCLARQNFGDSDNRRTHAQRSDGVTNAVRARITRTGRATSSDPALAPRSSAVQSTSSPPFPRSYGLAGTEFAIFLCRTHHRTADRAGDECAWWEQVGIDPVKVARELWRNSGRSNITVADVSVIRIPGPAGIPRIERSV